jgi:hypothetical protein
VAILNEKKHSNYNSKGYDLNREKDNGMENILYNRICGKIRKS